MAPFNHRCRFEVSARAFDSIPELKNSLKINIELAAPDDFVPALPGWEDRCRWIATHNRVDFYHFDFYTQALSKIERDHAKDRRDVQSMITTGLVDVRRLLELFREVQPGQWARYPAIEPSDMEARIKTLIHDTA